MRQEAFSTLRTWHKSEPRVALERGAGSRHADIRQKVRAAKITRTALVLVGPVLGQADFTDSRLYAPDHVHILRPKRRAAR